MQGHEQDDGKIPKPKLQILHPKTSEPPNLTHYSCVLGRILFFVFFWKGGGAGMQVPHALAAKNGSVPVEMQKLQVPPVMVRVWD